MLNYFTVAGDFRSVSADATSDADHDPELLAISGVITFTPLVASGDVLLAVGASPRPTGYVPVPISGIIDPADGRVKLRPKSDNPGEPFAPIRLLADDPILQLKSPLFYRVSFSGIKFGATPGTIAAFTFQAPRADVTVNLISVMRQPGQIAAGVTKIAPGTVRLEGGLIQFGFDGEDIPDGIPFTPIFTTREISDAGDFGTDLLKSATQAAALGKLGVGTGGTVVTTDGQQTLTRKTLSGANNTITNLPASSTPDAARLVCTTAVGGAVNTEWAKIATLNITGSNQSASCLLSVTVGGAAAESAVVSVTAYSRVTGNPNIVGVAMIAKSGNTFLMTDAFKVTSGAFGTVADLWVKKASQGATLSVFEIGRALTGATITYPATPGWQAATPTGAVEAITNGVTAAGQRVLTGDASTWPANLVTTAGQQTLTGKTLTSATLTSPLINGTASGTAVALAAAYGPGSLATTMPRSDIQGGFINGIHNDLAYNIERGGSVTVTKNGVTLVQGIDFLIPVNAMFNGGDKVTSPSAFWVINGTVNADVFVVTVNVNPTVSPTLWFNQTYGIEFAPGFGASNCKIEVFYSGAWTTIYNQTNVASPSVQWATHQSFGNSVTAIRYTLGNLGSSPFRIAEIFAGTSYRATARFMTRNGGEFIGTTAAPPTLRATGGDAAISINLIPKGVGTVNANGVPMLTTTGSQPMSNKTITASTIPVTGVLDSGTTYNAVKVPTPATATTAGKPGQWAASATHHYSYSGDGTTHSWRRTPHQAWPEATQPVSGSAAGVATALTLWTGTEAQFTALGGLRNPQTVYVVT